MKNKLFIVLLSLTLSSCSSVTIPDSKICSVAGLMSAGADCTTYLSHTRTSMTFNEFIDFLEPTPAQGGAVCMTLNDFISTKTAIEQACVLLGSQCTKEIKKKLRSLNSEIASFIELNHSKIK